MKKTAFGESPLFDMVCESRNWVNDLKGCLSDFSPPGESSCKADSDAVGLGWGLRSCGSS